MPQEEHTEQVFLVKNLTLKINIQLSNGTTVETETPGVSKLARQLESHLDPELLICVVRVRQFLKVQLILKTAGLKNLTFLTDSPKSTLIKLQRSMLPGMVMPLRFQLIKKVKTFNLSTLILLMFLTNHQKDITVFNSISMLDLNIPLRVKDTILRCIPSIYHMMVKRLFQLLTVSWLPLWDLCSPLTITIKALRTGKLKSSTLSSINLN